MQVEEEKSRLEARCEELGTTPRIWHRVPGYVIRNYSPDLEESVIQHMKQCFIREEPIIKGCGLADDPVSSQEHEAFVRKILANNISLIVIPEGAPGADLKPVSEKIVPLGATNVLMLTFKGDPFFDEVLEGEATKKILDTVFFLHKLTEQPFDKYDALSCVDGAGLGVGLDHRGRGLCKAVLEARFAMCRDLGIKVSKTIFSSPFSQRGALSCGFKEVASAHYSDFKEESGEPRFPNMPPESKAIVMLKVIT